MPLILWYEADGPRVRQLSRDYLMGGGFEVRHHDSMHFPTCGPDDLVVVLGDRIKKLLEVNGLVKKNRTISSLREQVFATPQMKFMITYAPSIADIDYSRGVEVVCDLQMAKRYALTGKLSPEPGEYRYPSDLTAFIKEVEEFNEKSGKPVPVSLDLETMGVNPYDPTKHILELSLSHTERTGTVISFSPYTQLHDHQKDDPQGLHSSILRAQLKWLLTTPKVSTRGANLKFDLVWIKEKWGLDCTNFKFDTLLVGSLLDENRSNSLKVHAKIMTPFGGYSDEFDKKYDKGDMLSIPLEERRLYAAQDADATLQVANIEQSLLVKQPSLARFYVRILHPAARAFEKVERCGVLVDLEAYQKVQAELEQELVILEDQALKCVNRRLRIKWGTEAKLTKAKFLADYMFSPMGLNLTPRMFTKKTGVPSTSMDHFEMFDDDDRARPFVKALKEYNSASKTLSTFVVGFLKHLRADGRFHPTYFLANQGDLGGTVTGRLSARDPAIQTLIKHSKWAKRLRSCFIAPKGMVLLGPDYCLPGDSLVSMSTGLKRIDQVEVGDFALVDGVPRKITFAGKTGEGSDVLRITSNSGKVLRCTPNHPVYVLREGVAQYIQASDLNSNDWLVYESEPSNVGKALDLDLAYVGGLFMGDGCLVITKEGKYRLKFACGKDVDTLIPELNKVFCRWSGVSSPTDKGDVSVSTKSACIWFTQRFSKGGSYDMEVPPIILGASLEARRAYISGAFDSDGSAHSGRVTISSVCEKYVRQLAILCSSIGVHGVIRSTERDTNFVNGFVCWHLDIFARESLGRFPDSRVPRKQAMLEKIRVKGYTQCRTQQVPAELIARFNGVGCQRTTASNRLFSNSRRNGVLTREAVKVASNSNPVLANSGIVEALNYQYDRVLLVEYLGQEDVYDLTVEDVHCFNVDGYRVHNCQGELKIAACFSGEPTMLKSYQQGIDLHAVTASGLAGWELEEFMALKDADPDKYDAIRQLGKAGNFGLCIAEGQKVLTQVGLVPIEHIQDWHLVWDGLHWVQHRGLLFKGYKECIEYDGLTATPDHKVWTDTGGKVSLGEAASKGYRLARTGKGVIPVRVGFPEVTSRDAEKGKGVLGHFRNLLRLFSHKSASRLQFEEWQDYNLQVSEQPEVQRSKVPHSGSTVRCDGTTMSKNDSCFFAQILRSWDQVSLRIQRALCSLGFGDISRHRFQGFGLRPSGQRRGLLTRESSLGNQIGKPQEPVKQKVAVYDLLNAGPLHRFTCEGVLVSNCYGMGAGGFQTYAKLNYGVDMTLEEATLARDKFFDTYPVLLEWHRFCKAYARKYKEIASPLGRIRHLPLINSPVREVAAKAERQAINSPVQSTLSDMSLWATAIMDQEFGMSKEGYCVIGMVHDQLLAYAPEDDAELWAERMKDVMENLPFEKVDWHPQLQFTADMSIGYNLAELKKWQAAGDFALSA